MKRRIAMKRMISGTALVVLFLFVFLFSCCSQKKEEQTKEQSYGAAPVKVKAVARQKISEKLFYTGTLEAWQKINITPDSGGKIARIYVEEGDYVREGQLLAELDTQALSLQLKQAEAAVAVADANYNDAKKNKERMDRLAKENAVSDQQYEKVMLALEAAQAQLAQARAALNLVRHSLNVSSMKAPFKGVVASKNAEVGDVINPMMGSFSTSSGVMTLMDFSRVKISIEVTGNDILRIKKGQPATLRVPSFPKRDFRGTVSLVNLTADPLTKKFRSEVTVENPDLTLRPGTFGEITLEVSTHENALVLPQKAILDNKYVFLAQGGKAYKREVTLGLQNSTLVEILDGVKEGDLVIVEGNFGLEDGIDIEIIEEVKNETA
jgi:RND family efflux transporter MFP subunit